MTRRNTIDKNFTYFMVIKNAIVSYSEGRATSAQIFHFMENTYPETFTKDNANTWKNNVRQLLSKCPEFIKTKKENESKLHFWRFQEDGLNTMNENENENHHNNSYSRNHSIQGCLLFGGVEPQGYNPYPCTVYCDLHRTVLRPTYYDLTGHGANTGIYKEDPVLEDIKADDPAESARCTSNSSSESCSQ